MLSVISPMESQGRSNTYSHILKYTGLFGGVQMLSILVSLVRNKLVALILGPYGMGLLSLFNSTTRFIGDATNLGLPVSAVKDISAAYGAGDSASVDHYVLVIRSWSLLTAMLGFAVCLVLSPILSYWTFGWGNHILHYMLLAPVVALSAVTGGELAVLKGVRQLRKLALISILGIVAALVVSVPLYIVWESAAIVPSLILIALSQALITVAYSWRIFAPKFSWSRDVLGAGASMVKLGLAFLFAGMFGNGADFLVRSFLNNVGSQNILGLYNAGFMMTVTYAGMVFSAMESDYFPRLSAVPSVGRELNDTVNRQIEVSLLIISPMLVFFQVGLPLLLPLLYSHAFMAVLPMMQVTVLAMYLRAVKLPIAYLPLARSDSRSYLLMEGIYAVVFVVLAVVFFLRCGLTGLGYALTTTAVLDFFMLTFYMRFRYGYRISRRVGVIAALQMPIAIVAFALTFVQNGWIYWMVGLLMALLSTATSLFLLRNRAGKNVE